MPKIVTKADPDLKCTICGSACDWELVGPLKTLTCICEMCKITKTTVISDTLLLRLMTRHLIDRVGTKIPANSISAQDVAPI